MAEKFSENLKYLKMTLIVVTSFLDPIKQFLAKFFGEPKKINRQHAQTRFSSLFVVKLRLLASLIPHLFSFVRRQFGSSADWSQAKTRIFSKKR